MFYRRRKSGSGREEQSQSSYPQRRSAALISKGLAVRGSLRGSRPLDAFFVSFCAHKKTPPPRAAALSFP